MKVLNLNYQGVLDLVSLDEIRGYRTKANNALETLLNKTGLGNNFLGWIDYPISITKEELQAIKTASKQIQSNSEVLVVVGIGGSYLGAKAALDMLNDYYPHENKIEVIFLGNTLSSNYTYEVLKYLENKDFSVNVISKSGTTTEPAIAFRLVRKLLYEKYGSKAKERIFVTTDKAKGALRKMADKEGYQSFVLPSDIGGRYSVLTPVGLLPMAVSGITIEDVLQGAKDAREKFLTASFEENEVLLYASIRNLLYQEKNKKIEMITSFEPNFRFFGEWWKQLFGESEGKNHLGLFPASIIYSADLHSMGQLIQDGERNLIETVVSYKKPKYDFFIDLDEENLDELNYLSKYSLSEINDIAKEATKIAHIDGGVPLIEISLEQNNPYNFGYLIYFFMLSCGVSGYLLRVNPFDQEGVEDYKRNMFALLDKSGYESLKNELEKRINEKNN